MRVDETRVFLFTFRTDQGDVQFPMRAETREEAGEKMQKTLQRMQVELAVDFPKIGSAQGLAAKILEPLTDIVPNAVPAEVLELRIDTLLGDMGAAELRGKAKADTVFTWTGYKFEEANYTHIITELELIKTGQKEIPAKKPKNG